MFGSIEGHVFDEVCQSLLGIAFQDRASFYYQAKLRSLFGLFVLLNIIGKSVVEGSGFYIGVQRKRPASILGLQPCRSEEHTSELQSLMRISYAVFCLKTKLTNIMNTII